MSDKPFYLANNTALRTASPADELLHPEANAGIDGDTLTETQYFGFNVPGERIHGLGYMWHHPNLDVVTGGLMVFQGVKPISIAAEIWDFRAFMRDSAIAGDLSDYRLDNGYGVKVLEPNRRFAVTYEDAARGNSVDLVSEAIMPVAMFGDGNHFEQGMKVTGKISLRGRQYAVDGFNVRDRSWGKLRPEAIMPVPPVSWMTGVFGEDFAFNCNLMDHAGSNPQVAPPFELPPEKALNGGWVWRDGKLLVVTSARKQVRREEGTFVPRNVQISMTLEDGSELVVRGEMIASCPYATWPNVQAHISLIEWEAEGRVGHGDMQDVVWNDFAVAAIASQSERQGAAAAR